MLYVQSLVHIADNSGGYYALCIRILSNSKPAKVGDLIVISIRSIIINKKLARPKKQKIFKGEVRKAVVLRTGAVHKRWGNIFLKIDSNAVALLGNWGLPLMNRARGPAMLELKTSKYSKFALICEGVL